MASFPPKITQAACLENSPYGHNFWKKWVQYGFSSGCRHIFNFIHCQYAVTCYVILQKCVLFMSTTVFLLDIELIRVYVVLLLHRFTWYWHRHWLNTAKIAMFSERYLFLILQDYHQIIKRPTYHIFSSVEECFANMLL